MSIRPQQMDPAKMATIEAHYCAPATAISQMFTDLMGHVRWQEGQLDRAKADPACFATEPGVIQADKTNEGRFEFVTSEMLRNKATAALSDKKMSRKARAMPTVHQSSPFRCRQGPKE